MIPAEASALEDVRRTGGVLDEARVKRLCYLEGTPKAPEIFASNAVNDVIVRFYGDTAVAQGNETWHKKSGETGRFVWTDTWLKRNGRWQIVAAEDLIAPVEAAK